jgi:hypothetical protein
MSVDAGYFRRWYGNLRVTDNLAVEASDFDTFNIAAPTAAGLSTTGTLNGLVDVQPARFGQVRNFDTLARKYGDQVERFDGIDVTVNARLNAGAMLSGGFSTGRWTRNNCEIVARVPEASVFTDIATGFPPGGPPPPRVPLEWCDQQSPWLAQVKFIGSYIIPVVDLQVSATMQSVPGPEIRADYVATNTVIAPALGRPLAGNQPNQTVTAIKPLSEWGERLNQVDLRLGKIFRFGPRRVSANLDIFNAFNADTVLSENPNFGAFRRPTSIVLARYLRVGATLEF